MPTVNPVKVLLLSHGALFNNTGYRRRIINELNLILGYNNKKKIIDLTLLSFVAFSGFNYKMASHLKAYALKHKFKAIQLLTMPLAGSVFLLIFNILYCSILTFIITARLKINIIHAQNLMAGFICALIKKIFSSNVKLIFDYHGVVPEEYLDFFPKDHLGYRCRKVMEKFTIHNADHIICVSNAFKEYLASNFTVLPNSISVMPSCVGKNFLSDDAISKSELKRKLGLDDKIVLVYSGNIGQWHSENQILSLCKNIVDRFPNVFIFFMIADSASKIQLSQKMISMGFARGSYNILNLAHEDVKYLLIASDIALLIRKKSVVNHVASPTKFAEYLATGLPVLLSAGIGDTAKIILDHNVGVLCDEKNKDSIYASFKSILELSKAAGTKHRCIKIASDYFNWDNYGDHLIDTYIALESS